MMQLPMILPERSEAAARRDDGIERAASHAERVSDGWKARARGYLLEYLATRRRGDDFLAEVAREFAEGRGMDAPPDGRAWGAVFQSAAREKLIVKAGYSPARSSNLSPKVLWRVA
jgi:hypothetical protein